MKKLVLILAAIIIVGGATMTSFGQHHHRRHNINQRQSRQQRRIGNGLRSGRLTSREAIRLERRESRTNRMERRMRHSGGGLSWRERRRLKIRLNKNSRAIWRQKHDRQHRRRGH